MKFFRPMAGLKIGGKFKQRYKEKEGKVSEKLIVIGKEDER